AVSAPMPRAAPDRNAILPSSRFMGSPFTPHPGWDQAENSRIDSSRRYVRLVIRLTARSGFSFLYWFQSREECQRFRNGARRHAAMGRVTSWEHVSGAFDRP